MARLTEERISHLAHLAVGAIHKGASVRNERLALIEAKKALAHALGAEDRLDGVVRGRMPRTVLPGSREWDILYRKLMEEEIRKAKL
ncbi:MAG: DUF507 family protein [Candidatus Binatia bacterium]